MMVRARHSYSFTEARVIIRVRFKDRVRWGLGFGAVLKFTSVKLQLVPVPNASSYLNLSDE